MFRPYFMYHYITYTKKYTNFWLIYISDALPGDADGNGKTNLKDLVLLQRHLNKWDVAIDLSVLDLNGDNKVNVKDLVLLRRKLTGWKV